MQVDADGVLPEWQEWVDRAAAAAFQVASPPLPTSRSPPAGNRHLIGSVRASIDADDTPKPVIEGDLLAGLIARDCLALHGSRLQSENAEARASDSRDPFFILAPYVAHEAISKLWHGDQPETSWIGIALVATSAAGMPLLGRAKRNLAHKLGSGATHGEGTQNILCGYLAVAVSAGLLGNALLGWWLDPVAALAIAALAVREGLESWRGETRGGGACWRSRRRAHRPRRAAVGRMLDRPVVEGDVELVLGYG